MRCMASLSRTRSFTLCIKLTRSGSPPKIARTGGDHTRSRSKPSRVLGLPSEALGPRACGRVGMRYSAPEARKATTVSSLLASAESAKRTVGLWDFCGTLWCSVVLRRDNCNGRPAALFKKISMKTKR